MVPCGTLKLHCSSESISLSIGLNQYSLTHILSSLDLAVKLLIKKQSRPTLLSSPFYYIDGLGHKPSNSEFKKKKNSTK